MADDVNGAFVKKLRKYTLTPELKNLTSKVLLDVFDQEASGSRDGRKDILRQIDEQNERLRKARELMLSSKIDPEGYSLIKKETEGILRRLEFKLTDYMENPFKVDLLLPQAIDVISNIADLY